MGLPLLHEAFKAVQDAPIPSVLLPPKSATALLDTLTRNVARADRLSAAWRQETIRLMKGLAEASREHLAQGGSSTEILDDLDRLRGQVESRLERTASLHERAHRLSEGVNKDFYEILFGDPSIFMIQTCRMQGILERDIEASEEFIDFLTVMIVDIDPQARGGPSFDKADDLIAYLNR